MLSRICVKNNGGKGQWAQVVQDWPRTDYWGWVARTGESLFYLCICLRFCVIKKQKQTKTEECHHHFHLYYVITLEKAWDCGQRTKLRVLVLSLPNYNFGWGGQLTVSVFTGRWDERTWGLLPPPLFHNTVNLNASETAFYFLRSSHLSNSLCSFSERKSHL